MRRVKHNVTFKKKEEPVDEPEDITDDGDTPDPEPKPTPIKDITEDKQEEVARQRRSWTDEDPEYKESQEEKPTLKPAKDLKEDEPTKKPPPKVADEPKLFDPSIEGIGADDEETREKIIESYWKELETAEEEGRVADFEKVGGANFIADLMDIPADNVNSDLYIIHYESKADVIRNDPYSKLETDHSVGQRENERLYSHILNSKAVYSLDGYKEPPSNLDYLKDDSEKTIKERLAEIGITQTLDEVENTPRTPLEELGRAAVERSLPHSSTPRKYARPRGEKGIPPIAHGGEFKLPENIEDEFILDLGAQFDAENKNWLYSDMSEIDREQYGVLKERFIRAVEGTIGLFWNELKPHLDNKKNSWNMDLPMTNYRHPVQDIRTHIVSTIQDTYSKEELKKLTDNWSEGFGGKDDKGEISYLEERGDLNIYKKLEQVVEDELIKKDIDPRKEQFVDQKLLDNIIDNINTEHGVGGRRLQDELGYNFNDISSRNVRFINMPVKAFQALHDPNRLDFEHGEDKETVDYFRERIRNGEYMGAVNLKLNPLTLHLDRHQGRHRAEAARLEGITDIPVAITLSDEIRSQYGRLQAIAYFQRGSGRNPVHVFGSDPNQDLPTTMSELEENQFLYRRFMGNGWDRTNQEFFGEGEMDHYWHQEATDILRDTVLVDATSIERKQANVEEVMFIKRIENIQHEAQRIGGIRSGYKLDKTLEPFFQNIPPTEPYDSRDMAPNTKIEEGIIIDRTKNIHGTTNIDTSEENIFTKIDLRDLNYAINTKEDDAKWDRANDKFNRLIYNNSGMYDAMEKAEAEVKAFNEMNRQKFNSGFFRMLYRSMPVLELLRMQKEGKLIKPNIRGRRGRGVFPFISMSVSPHSAMDETQPFHKAGGITVEFGSAAIVDEANALLQKRGGSARVKPVEYTTYPVKMMGETPDKNVWGIETIDSKMPAATMHELEIRFPLNTILENAVEGLIVDMGSYENLATVFENFGMKAEAKLYKKWYSEIGGGWNNRDTIINFLTGGKKGESKVPYSDIMPLTQSSILDKLDRMVKEKTGFTVDKEHPIPIKVRYKFERYSHGFDALIDNQRDGRIETEYKTSADIALGKDATTTYTQDGDKKIDHYMATTIEKITPTEQEHGDTMRTFEKLKEELFTQIRHWEVTQKKKIGVRSIFLGGSTGKGTYLAGFSDLDIFIEFEYDIPQKEIEDVVLELGKTVLKQRSTDLAGFQTYQEKYGVQGQNDDGSKFSHRYPEAHIDLLAKEYNDIKPVEVQFLGVSHVTKEQIARGRNGDMDADGNRITDGMRTGNDRSIMHTKEVAPLIKGKEHEVRLLKNFLQEIKAYDSSGKERGFSGYASELLIARLGSFKEVLKYFANFKPYSKLGNTDRNFDTMFVLPDEIDPNRNLAAAFSDGKKDFPLRKNFKLARLIKVSKFMLKHGRAPKFEESKRETTELKFDMPLGDENATYQQLYSAAKQIQRAIKKEGYKLDVVTEQISEDFEVDVPRIKIDIHEGTGAANRNWYNVSIDFGFAPEKGWENNPNMNLDREYWEAGIPVNQPEDRITAWKKAQERKHNKETGMFVPNFKIEKDENGVERFFIRKKRRFTFINEWLRDAIYNKTLGLGKINDYILTTQKTDELGETGQKVGVDLAYFDEDIYENITGDPDKHDR